MKATRKIVKIDESKCNGCGLCESACHEGAIKVIDGKARLVSDSYCDGLGACLGDCPEGAITIEERPAEEFSEEAGAKHLAQKRSFVAPGNREPACACPGSAVRTMEVAEPTGDMPATPGRSQLTNWPVQLMLVPPNAPFLKGADLLITADCVPFSFPDYHSRYLRGHVALIGCPKLDDVGYYREKIEAILDMARPSSVTVARMEVPCCGGLLSAVISAMDGVAADIPVRVITVGIDGKVLKEESIPKKIPTSGEHNSQSCCK
jgi:Fe-S-cluster-containing hydrogenase component 2